MNMLSMVANAATRRLESMFPGYFAEVKHNHYRDFGFPADITFDLAYAAYQRNSLARAAVDKTVGKTWQDAPYIQQFARDDGDDTPETKIEKAIRERFGDLRVWQNIAECDRRSLVGAYSGLILRLGDNKRFQEPVDRVNGGMLGLIEVIPAWEGQLQVNEWHDDETQPEYGKPKSFQFNEVAVGRSRNQNRQMTIHPDRVIVWSRDGTVNGRSALEPGYNDLMTIEKIVGAGGEGFWKNAKSSPILQVDPEASLDKIAAAMNVPVAEVRDLMDAQVEDWQKGFDRLLMLQGMKAETLGITLPSPEHFFAIAAQSFAASFSIPMKILIGSQTGERASTEDADEWNRTNMARRTDIAMPNIMEMVRRFERFGMIPEADWHIDWSDLNDPTPADKLGRADKMADVNVKMKDSGEFVFTPEEIRAETGREPLTDADKFRDPPEGDEEADALGDVPETEDEPAPAA